MVERVSALAGHLGPRRLGIVGDAGPGIRLSERRIASLWQVAAWPGRVAEAGRAAAVAAGAEAAPKPGQSAAGGAGTLLRTEPLKWLLVAERALPRPAVEAADATLLDLSHARTVLRIEGSAALDLLSRLVPLDLRPRSFPEGRVAASGLHHVGVMLHRRGPGFDLYLPRSFALSLFEHIAEAAAQFGAEIA